MILDILECILLLLLRPDKALAVVFWYLTRRRVRARLRLRDAIAVLPFAYARWLARCARADRSVLAAISRGGGGGGPIGVHIHIGSDTAFADLAGVIASVTGQTWRHWRVFVTAHDGAAQRLPADPRVTLLGGAYPSCAAGLRAALDTAATDYLVPLRPDCRLPRTALAAYAAFRHSRADRRPPILYGDQDEADLRGRRRVPWFKPEWDAEMFLAQDYLSVACAIPVAAARQAIATIDSASDSLPAYGLLLEMTGRYGWTVEHLHRVVVSTPPGFWSRPCPERLALLREVPTISRDVEILAGPFGTASIRWPLPTPLPLVSVIVPTRDRVELLRTCIEGVLAQTRYPHFEIVIADNHSVESATLAFFDEIVADPRVRVVSWPHPYNYSAINNFAVGVARGSYLCLLNNDIEIIDGDWMCELMRYAIRPQAGAVGARLLYPDLSIQHAGVVVGLGNAAGHAHRGLPKDTAGYFAHALVAHAATAVTAACLIVRRDLFEAVGGLDEVDLRIAYNDVDLCLKLREAGAKNYYVPSAMLVHHESKSRGLDTAPEHIARYLLELETLQLRWATTTFLDPAHHPVLDRGSETYKPAFPSSVDFVRGGR